MYAFVMLVHLGTISVKFEGQSSKKTGAKTED